MAGKSIETGVDKLVALIQKKKRMSVDDAAKELGVGPLVVQEWGEFLEEEGIISIEYSLSKVFLVERKMSSEETKAKAKEMGEQRDIMVRRIETAVSRMDYDTRGLESFKKEFEILKKDLGGDMDKVKDQLQELAKYETFKKTIDQKLKEQQKEFEDLLAKSHMQIDAEAKKYQSVIEDLGKEATLIQTERKQLAEDRAGEEALGQKLAQVDQLLGALRDKMGKEHAQIGDEEKHIAQLEKLAGAIKADIESKKDKELRPLMKLSEEHARKIQQMQGEIVEKSKEAKEGIDNFTAKGQEAAKRFISFFDRRVQIEKLLAEIDKQHQELKDEMQKLQRKALAFSVGSKGTAALEDFKDLEKRFKEVEAKKGWFEGELNKLTTLLHTK